MSLPSGTRLGVYEIVAPIGAGGMGEVYRARDTRLNREVAIKVLSGVFAGDPERVVRIEREAQILASLNHANIAHIHGVEESGTGPALVMELVEGEDLAVRIGRGALPQSEAIAIAAQIVEALAAAHDKGIVHRDLKPANIKVGANGAVKVLDFGLAKALDPLGDSPIDRADSPTITSASTRIGAVLGTAAYMAPEQAKGIPADKRADIWAFGCVLFEMLTGRSAFPGRTITETIAAVLEREPEWRLLPAHTPAGIRRLLRRCLEKDPKRRLHDIADARLEIDDVRDGTDAPIVGGATRSRAWPAWAWVLILVAPVAAAAAGWMLRPVPQVPEARLDITTPSAADPSFAISPDGRAVVFSAGSGREAQLWLRALDSSSSARPVPGTQQGTFPFWSPDGRSIGFFADAKLKRVDIDGGSPQTLWASAAVPLGGTWNREGTILFANNPGGSILRISDCGGPATPATTVDLGTQRGHYYPQFLPDGRHFLFFMSSGRPEVRGMYVGELGGSQTTRVLDVGPVVYAATGHLLFVRGGKIFAQGFDAGRQKLEGDPFIVEEPVRGDVRLAATAAGPIAYRTGSTDGQRQFAWIDRAGRELEKVVYDGSAAQGPALSHDGRRIAVFRFLNGNMDIWSYDTRRHAWDKLTFDPGDDIYPLWSPGDTGLVFGGVRKSENIGLFRTIIGAPPGNEEQLLPVEQGAFPMDWSNDGRFLLYTSLTTAGLDLWALPMDAPRKPFEIVRTEFNETMAQFSPDGKWIAYQSDKTGRDEIYLRPFPGPGPDARVSIDGGTQVRWNPDGRELFYVAADDRLMAVPIAPAPDGKTIEPGAPSALFTTRVGSTATLKYRQQYVVSGDGKSFVMNSIVAEPIHLADHGDPELEAAPLRRLSFALLLCWVTLSTSTCRRSTLPFELSDKDYWALLESLSEPAGTFSISDNLVSNEPGVAENVRKLSGSGGVYIGVGPEQNFSYIAELRPTMAFVIDIRRENRTLHLLYKALFTLSSDRADFVSRLFSRSRPDGLGSRASAQEIFTRYAGVPPSPGLLTSNTALVRDLLLKTHGFPLSEADLAWIDRVFKAFYTDGPEIQFWESSDVDALKPTYRQLMTARDAFGKTRSFLATEGDFTFVKELQSKNMIIPVVGDFGGPRALRAIGDYVRQRGDEVHAFYGSNVGVYLTNKQTLAFCRSLAALPAGRNASFIERDGVRLLSSKLKACPR